MSKVLQSDQSPIGRPLTNNELSWVGSVPSLAGVFGAPLAVYIADKYGRRIGIMSVAFLQALCWVIKLLPLTIETLILARICCGLGGAATFNTVPIYVKDICQANIRGRTGLLMMLSQNIGILAMYAMGAYLDYYIVLWIVLVMPVLSIALLFLAPESPAFLVKVNKAEEATATIAKLRGLDATDKVVQNEMDIIKREDEAFKSIADVSFKGILKQRAWRRGFFLMMVIIIAHACNGAFTIITYASMILKQLRVIVSPELQSLSIPVFMIFASLVSMSLVERLGRKVILATCYIISAIALGSLGTILVLQQQGMTVPGWMPIVVIIVTVCCYAAAVSPMPFVIMSEMFNFQVRSKVMCCLLIEAWLLSFMQLFSYTRIADAFGAHVAFFIFVAINVFGAFCVLVFLPETKGKTVEEIENDLLKRKLR
ncbi:hypothetical protein O3G_MSEX010171 [Manduca sexta]|nr:hypothetical protein O3G_MSEX010171 [Manduca sexta]